MTFITLQYIFYCLSTTGVLGIFPSLVNVHGDEEFELSTNVNGTVIQTKLFSIDDTELSIEDMLIVIALGTIFLSISAFVTLLQSAFAIDCHQLSHQNRERMTKFTPGDEEPMKPCKNRTFILRHGMSIYAVLVFVKVFSNVACAILLEEVFDYSTYLKYGTKLSLVISKFLSILFVSILINFFGELIPEVYMSHMEPHLDSFSRFSFFFKIFAVFGRPIGFLLEMSYNLENNQLIMKYRKNLYHFMLLYAELDYDHNSSLESMLFDKEKQWLKGLITRKPIFLPLETVVSKQLKNKLAEQFHSRYIVVYQNGDPNDTVALFHLDLFSDEIEKCIGQSIKDLLNSGEHLQFVRKFIFTSTTDSLISILNHLFKGTFLLMLICIKFSH